MALIESYKAELVEIISGPLHTVQIVILLYIILGPAAIYGIAVALGILCLQLPLNSIILRIRRSVTKATDERLNIVKTII